MLVYFMKFRKSSNVLGHKTMAHKNTSGSDLPTLSDRFKLVLEDVVPTAFAVLIMLAWFASATVLTKLPETTMTVKFVQLERTADTPSQGGLS